MLTLDSFKRTLINTFIWFNIDIWKAIQYLSFLWVFSRTYQDFNTCKQLIYC